MKLKYIKTKNLESRLNPGYRRIYRFVSDTGALLDDYLAADYADTIDRGPETMVFSCDRAGEITNWNDLFEHSGDWAKDDKAVKAMGYEIV